MTYIRWHIYMLASLVCLCNNVSSGRIHIIYCAPFFSLGGYSSEAFANLQGIDIVLKSYTNITLSISHHGDSYDAKHQAGRTLSEINLLNKYNYHYHPTKETTLIEICHSEPGAWSAPTPKYMTHPCPMYKDSIKIGRTMFETSKIPSQWNSRMNNYMDYIWVPTKFQKEIFTAEGVINNKIRVIQESVDTDFYSPKFEQQIIDFNIAGDTMPQYTDLDSNDLQLLVPLVAAKRQGRYFFFCNAKWEQRKGIFILLQAYMNEFSLDDESQLIILTNVYHSTNDFYDQLLKFAVSQGVTGDFIEKKLIILSNLPQRIMPYIYSLSDAFVLPTRGEGWGRPIVESMSCGIPVIATNYSGPTEYLNTNNSFPLPIDGLVPCENWEGHQWAEPSLTNLQELMRDTYNNPSGAKLKGKQAREDMIHKYSLEIIGKKIIDEIIEITM